MWFNLYIFGWTESSKTMIEALAPATAAAAVWMWLEDLRTVFWESIDRVSRFWLLIALLFDCVCYLQFML